MIKFLTLCLSALLLSSSVFAQNGQKEEKESITYPVNNIKLNLFSLGFKTASLQYERGLNRHMSVSLGARIQPQSSLPFKNSILKYADLSESDTAAKNFIETAKMSSWAITPEFRYYFGKKPLNGFYIAPFARVGNYALDWNYFYTSEGKSKDIELSGNMLYYSVGVMFGAQWHLNQHVLIDWWILGPSYGSGNLSLKAKTDLSDMSDEDLQKTQDAINSLEIMNYKLNLNATVSKQGVKANGTIPFPGLRTGLCIGFCF